jgi:hypothetical protein
MPSMAGRARCALALWVGSDSALTLLRPSQARRRLEMMGKGPRIVSAYSLAVFARVSGEN